MPRTRIALFALVSFGTATPLSAAEVLFGLRARSRSEIYTINPNTGAGSHLGITEIFVGGGMAARAEDETVWAISRDELHTIDPATGTSVLLHDFDFALRGDGLAYDPARDLLYASDFSDGSLYSIDPETGDFSFIGTPGPTAGLAFDIGGNVLYGVVEDVLVSIDTGTGIATEIGELGVPVSTSGAGLTFDITRNRLYLAARSLSGLYSIDPQTGTASPVGPVGASSIHGLAYIPEPGSTLLAGIASLLLLRRRRTSSRP